MSIFSASPHSGLDLAELTQSSSLSNQLARATVAAAEASTEGTARLYSAIVVSPVFSGFYADIHEAHGDLWFEHMHVMPRSVALGNVASTTNVDFEVYNAYRYDAHAWIDFQSNLGDGVSFVGLPSLPAIIAGQDGVVFEMVVESTGEPSIDSTLDFEFDTGFESVPIEASRVVAFTERPQIPIREILSFKTQVIEALNGFEQRIALRRAPRQTFDLTFVMQDGSPRQRFENLMFDWQGRIFGLPMWHERCVSTATAAAAATSVSVDSTAYSDFRVNGLAMILSSAGAEILKVSSIGGTSLSFASALTLTHPAGAEVFPARAAITQGPMNVRRYPADGVEIRLRFLVVDNDVSLGSTAAFSTFNSKVLLDDDNFLDEIDETVDRKITVIDNETGNPLQEAWWDNARRGSRKSFFSRTKQRTWEVRQLLHALGGRLTSFYAPSRGRELTPTAQLTSGGSTLTVENTGYATYTRQRQARNVIRVVLTDGTILTRTVTGSSVVNATTEQLTVSASWPSTIPVANIQFIELLEKVRIDSDDIEFLHGVGHECDISFPTRTVLE